MKIDDFIGTPVPIEGRQNAFSVFLVWVGFIIVVGTMAVGGGLATKATVSDIVAGVIIGNVLLGVFAAFSGWIGTHSGMTFYQLGERVFGKPSMRIVGLYVPMILIGWFAIEAAILGGFLGKFFDLSDLVQRMLMFVSALVMAASTFYGFKALKYLSYVLVPIIFSLGLFAITQTNLSGLENRQNIVENPESIFYVASIVVSTWVMGVLLNLPDVTRFAKYPWQGALIGFLGILVGNVFNLIIGMTAAINTGSYDPSDILIGLGVASLAVLFAVANIWTTNDSNLYSATLGVSRSFNLSRRKAVVVCGGIGALVAVFNPATISSIFTLLITVGASAPALGGVVLGAYIVSLNKAPEAPSPISAWTGWIFGSLIGIYFGGLLGIMLGFFSGWLLVVLGYYLFKNKAVNRNNSHM